MRLCGGIRHCQDAGIKVGVRFAITGENSSEIPAIFDFIEKNNIPRACFYHLVYSGRGSALADNDLSHIETREVVDLIMDRTRDLFDRGMSKEILTVDNHADGPYIYLRLLKEDPKRAADVLELLRMNEGNNSGTGDRLCELGWRGIRGSVLEGDIIWKCNKAAPSAIYGWTRPTN